MQLDPAIHTKEFLLSYPDAALDLAKNSPEFAKSDLVNDFEIIKLANNFGNTVAHLLAEFQPAWMGSEAAKSLEILKLVNNFGNTVAHLLAEFQPAWLGSEAAKSLEILKLANNFGETVAHKLAVYQPEWIHSEAAKSLEILKLANNFGSTVAHTLASNQPEWLKSEAVKNLEILKINSKWGSVALRVARKHENCINNEPLFHKQVLTLEHEGKSLAEEISVKYKSKGFDLPVMAMKLISQGAAYKHSKPIAIKSGEAILEQCKTQIEDGLDPLVSLKHLQALYSTFSHNVSKIISTQEQKSLKKWQSLLLQSENLIRQHLDKHPGLYDIDHTVDIFCEPGDDLIKKLQSERILNSNLNTFDELNAVGNSELVPNSLCLY